MQDYLSQLINRARQPSLTVQPRPVSRFESPRYPAVESVEESPEFSNFLESAAAGESGEPEVRSALSDRFVTGMEADEPVQPAESNRHESGITDALFRNSPAAQSSMISRMSKPVFTRQPVRETDSVAASDEQIVPVSRAAEPARSVMRQKNAAEKATGFLNNALSGQPEHSEHTERITRRRQAPVEPDTGPDIRPDTIARQPTDISNSISARILPESAEFPAQGKREPHQPRATFNKPATIPGVIPADSLSAHLQPTARNQSHIQTAKASTHPLIPPVRVEDPGSKPISPYSAPVTVAHRAGLISKVSAQQIEPLPERRSDSIVRPHFSLASERAIFKQPFAEPDALQHAAEQMANTPAPTIQVTIGRIEVRATVAATSAAVRKAPARSSTMSLDDYLKQRSGRQR